MNAWKTSILVGLILLVSALNGQAETRCIEAEVRDLIDEITNQQPEAAARRLSHIRTAYPDYPLSDFYRSAIQWSRHQFSGDDADRKEARRGMLAEIDNLAQRFQQAPSLENRFSLGVANGLAARIFIFDGQYFKAYRLGSEAKEHIAKVYQLDPNNHDVRLFIGLFEYYTSSVPDEFSWLSRLIQWNGDRELGVRHLEHAVQNAPIFAHEAARALLMEVNWQLPKVCEYLPLAEWLAIKNGQNPYYSLTLQGVYLRCGHPEKSLIYNGLLENNKAYSKDIVVAKTKARLRAHAQRGDVEAIKRERESALPQAQRYAYWFALANAYDVIDMRAKAIEVYKKITAIKQLAPRFKAMAVLRQSQPYKAPAQLNAVNALPIAKACH